jgi:hypothetical protein
LKERTKERLFAWSGAVATARAKRTKVFLLLFLQKKKNPSIDLLLKRITPSKDADIREEENNHVPTQLPVRRRPCQQVGRQLLARRFLGEPIILYRTEAEIPSAPPDRCPRRFVPFSIGELSG